MSKKKLYIIALLLYITLQSSCYLYSFDKPSHDTQHKLKEVYAINLSTAWTKEQADSLLEIFDSIFTNVDSYNHKQNPSVWKLSDEVSEGDMRMEIINSLKHVSLSHDIFSTELTENSLNSNKRLFRVVAQFITDDWTNIPAAKLILKDGTDRYAIELVLKEVYGLNLVHINTPESDKIKQKLHKYVGDVHISQFTNQELMDLMSVYLEFPIGLHKIPRMKYLLRSRQAPYAGSAWIVADCVEYAASTFRTKNRSEFRRIIIHEKAHFLWEYALNGKLRKQWSDIGGWQKDPNNKQRWSTNRNKKEFVTAYASAKNPNEDWAESVAFYLINPNKLKSCSNEKYDFIDRVMQKYSNTDMPFKRLQNLD